MDGFRCKGLSWAACMLRKMPPSRFGMELYRVAGILHARAGFTMMDTLCELKRMRFRRARSF